MFRAECFYLSKLAQATVFLFTESQAAALTHMKKKKLHTQKPGSDSQLRQRGE